MQGRGPPGDGEAEGTIFPAVPKRGMSIPEVMRLNEREGSVATHDHKGEFQTPRMIIRKNFKRKPSCLEYFFGIKNNINTKKSSHSQQIRRVSWSRINVTRKWCSAVEFRRETGRGAMPGLKDNAMLRGRNWYKLLDAPVLTLDVTV